MMYVDNFHIKQIVSLFFIFVFTAVGAQEVEDSGRGKLETTAKAQINSWVTMNLSNPLRYQAGGRFIPEINFGQRNTNIKFDAQLSFNTVGMMNFQGWKQTGSYEKFSPYRMWARMSGNQFEIRVGLQKINFGSAKLLRPLMWFDRIDPRDPLQLTDGVYALLGRYYFRNNANIWLWALMGNDKTKGWEMIASTKTNPEYGGRFQFPLAKGEIAISFDRRKADLSGFYQDTIALAKETFLQSKYALDGKWDIGIGIWFEYMLEKNNITGYKGVYKYEHAANIGMDYTFFLGNGLNASTEFFYLNQSDKFFESEVSAELSALSVNYPIGLINRISAIIFYSWEDDALYRFISLQKKFDYWSFYFMAFWNPEQYSLYNFKETQFLFSGKGIQIMAVYNF